MAPDTLALLQSIEREDPDRQINQFLSQNMTFAMSPTDPNMATQEETLSAEENNNHRDGSSEPLLQENCDDSFDRIDGIITMDSTTKVAAQMVAPFLAKHIPDQYAPLGAPQLVPAQKDPNTKYCYRHRPDSKCKRTADEPTMEMLQRNLESLTQADQQGITHVWSLFSAAPAKHRNLMLQGILSQCCFPQLSFLSNSVKDLIRIDFLSALPSEISFKILCFLDTTALCKASQVSRRWRILADDDVVWHKMCEQHIDRKCTKCGWGLPLLERKRLRDWKRQEQLRANARGMNEWSPQLTPLPEDLPSEYLKTLVLNKPGKRDASSLSDTPDPSDATKRQRVEPPANVQKFRPWKDVYRDRFKVGTNWKYGRCSTKIFKGHTNGVMCLQFDDNILATGSYDTTIKIWNMDTGECIRTLRGHTSGVRTLQFDDSKLISGSLDRTVKIWNWRTGQLISTLDGHTEGVIAVHFDGSYLASGSVDKSIRVLDFKTRQTRTLTGHNDWVNSVKVDSASRTLFSASDDLTVRLWDLDTMKTIREFDGHVGQVQQVIVLPAEYEPDEVDADTAADDGSSSTSDERSTSPNPPSQSLFERWPASRPRPARYIMTAGLDSNLRLWDVDTGRCIKTFFGHVEGIWALAADTLRVVSGAEDRMVKVWDARSGRCQRTFTGHAGPVTCIGLSDSRMATGSEDHEVRLYSFKSEEGHGSSNVHDLSAATSSTSAPATSGAPTA